MKLNPIRKKHSMQMSIDFDYFSSRKSILLEINEKDNEQKISIQHAQPSGQ